MESIIAKFPLLRGARCANYEKGARTNRQLTKVGYIEVCSRDIVQRFVSSTQKLNLTTGAEVLVKKSLTAMTMSRIWALGKATDLVKAAAGGREVLLDKKERKVTVNGSVIFFQRQNETRGTFVGEFS